LWTILAIPALLALFCVVLEAANLWLSRTQLQNALEAAALAGVKTWGDAKGGSTYTARRIAVGYASYNGINGVGVQIDDNYSASGDVNQNDKPCDGDLIFGQVTENASNQWVFNTKQTPRCGSGSVLVDATGQGNLNTGNHNEWGIAFHRDQDTHPSLRITSIVLELPPGTGNSDLYFNLIGADSPLVSDNSNDKVTDGSYSQVDVFGFTDFADPVTSQIRFSPTTGLTKAVTITFHADGGVDDGFAPCDRFRFGMNVKKKLTGTAEADADDVGRVGLRVTVNFSDATSSTATFSDTSSKNLGACGHVGQDTYCPNSGIVHPHPALIPDLPCPPAQGLNNDGQSWAITGGAGGGKAFGVRAQARVAVTSLCAGLCGIDTSLFQVGANATAMYDCTQQEPRLIRVLDANFLCGP